MRDPDPRVNGGGFRRLRKLGVTVEVGLLEEEAVRLNESFVKVAKRKLPFVTLKGAVSLDGRIATRSGDSKWITSAEARKHARVLRRENDVVAVGIGTVVADDPLLTPRPGKSSVIRVVMDTHLRMSPKTRLAATVDKGPVVVFSGPDAPLAREDELSRLGVEVRRVSLTRGKPDLRKCLESLADRGVTRVLVEGGGELHGAFIEEGLADRLLLYIAPRLIGGRQARPLVGGEGPMLMSQVKELKHHRICRVGREILVEADLST
jgi:diaminohydroxyphosphoribosylaminopyrimidine deaminase/5-amino-6-(5-phosphoribosylamino)uracil reductase